MEISFNFKARYARLGTLGPQTKQLWFVLHGYGQLAGFFIRKFQALAARDMCVIAPEGLSRFYLEGHSGRVGASWMTRENRLMDIDNYLAYLDALYDKEKPAHNIPITVLGFSQGAATASRWIMNGHVPFNRLILWAGVFPPDMDFDKGHQLLKDREVYLVYGENDPFLTDARFTEQEEISRKLGIRPHRISFDGGHVIDPEVLEGFSS